MFRYRLVSVFLVLLVSVLCPAACGLRAAAADGSAPRPDCCGDRHSKHEAPTDPGQPTNPSPDACFCSTHGVTIEKADVSHLLVQLVPFTDDVPDDASQTNNPAFDASQPLLVHPPDPQRLLPLLI